MRVAIVGDYPLNSEQIRGGVEAAFCYLVRELACLPELDLHVITLGSATGTRKLSVADGRATLHVLPQFPRLELAKNFGTYQKTLNSALAGICPDVVHAQGATDHAYVALRSGYPTVITVHGVQSEDSKYQGNTHQRLRKWLYSRLIERYNLSHTRHLIALSRYVTKYFAAYLKPGTTVHYIPNAIDDRFFQLRRTVPNKTILYAGRIIRRKRALDLVEAFAGVVKAVPEAQLRMAGEYESEPDYVGQVRAVIQREHLESSVQLLGSLSEKAVLDEFHQCTMLALPSIQETTPMVIAQAMAAGKPVVSTPVGGIPEMITHGESGLLVPVGEIGQLQIALQQVLTDCALQSKLGRAARLYAQENYHATAVAFKTYHSYGLMRTGNEYAQSYLYSRAV